MTDLTEQWKKGELKLGEHYYYTTIFSPTVHIQNFTRDVVSFQDFKETVAEVLAPVPSYSEYLALQSDQLAKIEGEEIVTEIEAENAKLKEEYEAECHRSDELEDSLHIAWKDIDKLKELLKECKERLIYCTISTHDVQSKIDEVLK